MNVVNRQLLTVVLFALSFFIINEYFSYYLGLESAKVESFNKDKLILNNLTSAQSKNVEILATILASDMNVKQAYIQNNPNIIREHIMPIWKSVKDKKLTYEIHFFKPPAISFVNFSNFKSIGKDVSDVRTDIEWVTTSFKASTHTLMCKTYAGLRATNPIFDDKGNILGGISLGKKIDWIPETLKEKTQHNSFFVYTKKSTNSLAKKYYKDFMKDKTEIGEYILANKTINVSEQNIKEIDFTKDIQDITIDGTNYTLLTYPLIDFNNEVMGYACTLTLLDEFKTRFFKDAMKNFMLIIISALVILFITRKRIMYLVDYISYLKKITNSIKQRDFAILYKRSKQDNKYTQTLVGLEDNIIDMGLELQKQYNILKDDNRQKTQLLIKQLYTDGLTGLANRSALYEDLEINKEADIALFNISNFKDINDAFGFSIGNYILKEIALKFISYTKEKNFKVYRMGGDEFLISSNNEDYSKNEFEAYVLEIINKIDNDIFYFENKDITIHINMYAAICFDKHKRLEKADMALAHAKKERRGLIVFKEEESTKETHLKNIKIVNEIIQAIHDDNIIMYYQPIVDANQNTHKYEALVRMRLDGNILAPSYFLDISKRTKHYNSISKIVIEKTFEMFKNVDKSFSINLTADDMLNVEIVNLINYHLTNHKRPKNVVFEILESDELYNIPQIQEFIHNVKKLGSKIAIDDFGSGYSNFSYMLKIQPDYLKIDGSLIKNIDVDANAYKIVKTIVSFANQLNIKTIAEFVHKKEIFDICKDLGVDEFQGYYFSEPKITL
ncbi:MAG: diguanylate cyclase (GGDEF)-like protein [Sulfurimonas sp.]|jgi:diguanylate cyclase (GGDEF)-like protein